MSSTRYYVRHCRTSVKLAGARLADPMPARFGSGGGVAFGGAQRMQRSGDQLRASRSMLDLVSVRLTIRTKMDDETLLGVSAADLLVDLGRGRRGPRPDFNEKRVALGIIREPVPSWPKPPVPKRIQHGLAVVQSDHAPPPALARDEAPVSRPAIGLLLDSLRRGQHARNVIIADACAPGSAATRFIASRTPERRWR